MSTDSAPLGFPLYHGTSSWFLRGILTDGLGQKDVHGALRSREFLRDVWKLRQDLSSPEEHEILAQHEASLIEHALSDRVSAGGFNFRYGSVYCTGDQSKAVSYATGGHGSELVAMAGEQLTHVQKKAPASAASLLAKYPDMAACLSYNHAPILLKFAEVDARGLRGENGEPYVPSEIFIDRLVSYEVTDCNLLGPMRIYYVDDVETDYAGPVKYELNEVMPDEFLRSF